MYTVSTVLNELVDDPYLTRFKFMTYFPNEPETFIRKYLENTILRIKLLLFLFSKLCSKPTPSPLISPCGAGKGMSLVNLSLWCREGYEFSLISPCGAGKGMSLV